MSTSLRRILQTAASAIVVLDLVAAMLLFIHIPGRSALSFLIHIPKNSALALPAQWEARRSQQKLSPQCETLKEMIDYTNKNTNALDAGFESQQPPRLAAYQRWSDGMQQYTTHLGQLYAAQGSGAGMQSVMDSLAHGSREIVLLFQYASLSDTAPVSDKNPPPLWIKRYNDVSEQFEQAFAVLNNGCPA